MEPIAEVVETALKSAETHVGAEAVKVETDVNNACAHLFACIKCNLTRAEAQARDAINALKVGATPTQAEIEAEEDAELIEGAATRFARRLWSAI